MASGEAILGTLEGAGVELALEDKGFRVVRGKLTVELLALVRINKDAVAGALRERMAEVCACVDAEKCPVAGSGHCGIEVAPEPLLDGKAVVEASPAPTPPPLTKNPSSPQYIAERTTPDLLLDLALLYRGIADDLKLGVNGTLVKVSRLHMEAARDAVLSDTPVESLSKLGIEVIAAIKVREYNERLHELERRGVDMMLFKAAISILAVYKARDDEGAVA